MPQVGSIENNFIITNINFIRFECNYMISSLATYDELRITNINVTITIIMNKQTIYFN